MSKKTVKRSRTRTDDTTPGLLSRMRKSSAKPKEVPTGDLIAMICKAASERWPEDKSRPGVQIAHLPAEEGRMAVDVETSERRGMLLPVVMRSSQMPGKPARWYVALHRYGAPVGQDRHVVCKAESSDLDEALLAIGKYVANKDAERTYLAAMLRTLSPP